MSARPSVCHSSSADGSGSTRHSLRSSDRPWPGWPTGEPQTWCAAVHRTVAAVLAAPVVGGTLRHGPESEARPLMMPHMLAAPGAARMLAVNWRRARARE